MTRKHPSIAVVVTVFNEKSTILALLESLAAQTHVPTEICIVDGGSTDATLAILKASRKKYNVTVIAHAGNRSVCRNLGVASVSAEWIAVTDAGCVADTHWLSELWSMAEKSQADCVAGNAVGAPKTALQQAMIPFVLVMPDVAAQIAQQHMVYLPATRSLLIKRKLWLELGGLPEGHRLSEDYIFARKLVDPATEFERRQPKLAFAPNAKVSWQPPRSIVSFTRMIAEHAEGDAYAGLARPKAVLVVGRYISAAVLLGLWAGTGFPYQLALFMTILFIAYLLWAKLKHARYVGFTNWWSSVLQLAADLGVCTGTLRGTWRRLKNVPKKYDEKVSSKAT